MIRRFEYQELKIKIMKEKTNRRGTRVSSLLLAMALMAQGGLEAPPLSNAGTIRSGGPMYFPRRGKLKGYQKQKTSFNKNR